MRMLESRHLLSNDVELWVEGKVQDWRVDLPTAHSTADGINENVCMADPSDACPAGNGLRSPGEK